MTKWPQLALRRFAVIAIETKRSEAIITTTATTAATGAGTSALYNNNSQGGCYTQTHTYTHTLIHTNIHSYTIRDTTRTQQALPMTRDAATQRTICIYDRTKFTCVMHVRYCPQQQPLKIQLKAMHEIQMLCASAATLRSYSHSVLAAQLRRNEHTTTTRKHEAKTTTTPICIYSPRRESSNDSRPLWAVGRA